MSNQTIDLIQKRRSHRRYCDQQITPDQLETLMTAVLYSPSARDLQPWHFSFVQNRDLLLRINKAAHKQARLLSETNRNVRFMEDDFHIFYHAPTAVVISAAKSKFAPIDCGIAVQTLALAAQSLGLGSVIVGLANLAFEGDERSSLEKALAFPQSHQFMISIAIGFPADEKDAHPINPSKITLID